jgi:ribosomal protein S18 acetylase RimI-like enzyme
MNPQIEKPTKLSEQDLDELCEATEEAIIDGNGFGWLKPPQSRVLQSYWKGVLLVPQRELFIARLAGHIVGSAQLLKPPPNNEAQSHSATLTTFFIAPDARGHGLARGLLQAVEDSARAQGFDLIDLDVRETQAAAISLYEGAGFKRWAIKQRYAKVNGAYVAGWFYSKNLTAAETTDLVEVSLSEAG